MSSYVFDIETDDINATKIWCMSLLDINTGVQTSFDPSQIKEGLEVLEQSEKLIGHNIIGFDIPVIKKLTGINLSNKEIVDTLVLSRLFNPVREGGHGLEKWGQTLKSNKIDFHNYSKYSLDMLKYCEQDVALNFKVYKRLRKEAAGFTKRSVYLEHEIAKIVTTQREYGFLFDLEAGMKLIAELNSRKFEIDKEIKESFLPKKQHIKITPLHNKDGKLLKTGRTDKGTNVRLKQEEFSELLSSSEKNRTITRTLETEFNPNSRKQIGEYLQDLGWKPKEFTPKGQPKVDEKILSEIKNIPQAQLLAEFLMLQKRITQVDSWLDDMENDNRVRGFVNHNGTITGRMTHRNPNMAQVPSVSSTYGKECRSCWIVKPDYKLVGIDASGLELRMLAHYMNDKEYTNEIINGDIHTANQELAGLESRDQAKTFIYALLYGAGDEKLGTVVGGSKRDGKELRESFITNLPSFKNLKGKVGREAKKGFIKGLDGRRLLIRSEHSALNTLLQSAGSIVMKHALVVFNNSLGYKDAHFVANVHDEWQLEVKEELAPMVGSLGIQSIILAGEDLELNCPLDGEYKIGNNWSETH